MREDSFLFVGTEQRPSCHCASIAELPADAEAPHSQLFATWYAGTHEKHTDVAVMCNRHDGSGWGEPRVLVDPPGQSGGNTVVYCHEGELWHFYDIIEGEGWNDAMLYLARSSDGGRTWTDPELFDDRPGMMVRNRPVRLSTGRILLPAYDERGAQGLAYMTDDGGAAWREGGRMVADDTGVIQPAIIERDDGSLHAILRTGHEASHARECDSADGGETWTRCVPSALHNPGSGADMIRLASGEVIACFNDTPQGRTPLTLAISHDEGRTWSARRNIEEQPGEYSYPTLMEGSDGSVHLVYTWRRERIRHVSFEARWIEGA